MPTRVKTGSPRKHLSRGWGEGGTRSRGACVHLAPPHAQSKRCETQPLGAVAAGLQHARPQDPLTPAPRALIPQVHCGCGGSATRGILPRGHSGSWGHLRSQRFRGHPGTCPAPPGPCGPARGHFSQHSVNIHQRQAHAANTPHLSLDCSETGGKSRLRGLPRKTGASRKMLTSPSLLLLPRGR